MEEKKIEQEYEDREDAKQSLMQALDKIELNNLLTKKLDEKKTKEERK